VIVTLKHLRSVPGLGRRPGYCGRGTRAFFELHGLDWDQFRHQGIDAELLEATKDPLALKLAAWARQCEAANGQQ